MEKRPIVEELLPLTPRVFLLLWALDAGPRHGYALLEEVEELGRGKVSFGPASLYEAIHRLRDRGLLEETDAPPSVESDDSRRKYYRLTEHGREVLRVEAARLAELVSRLEEAGIVDGSKAS